MHIKTLTVSELNSYIKKVLDNDFILRNACIKGEISNLKIHSSGHMYFSLKDEYGKINCIMFRSNVSSLKFHPQDGDKVILEGRVSVYVNGGAYQFYCEKMKQDGVGDLFLTFEKLKVKLSKEGIFDDSHKKNIPKYCKKIGVITSPTGAAIRDIINVVKRRNSSVDLLIYPALVQGEKASADLIKGIEYLNKREDIDIIILARGGGSIEELWAFNEENLAYAIYKCNKPVISGVGHETDFTICDFASDFRAPTPSAAAEIAVFDLGVTNDKLLNYKSTLFYEINRILNTKFSELKALNNSLKLYNPTNYIANKYIKVDSLIEKLNYMINGRIDFEKGRLSKINSLLSAHNPLNVLNKGYSVIKDSQNRVVSSSHQMKELEEIKIIFKDGKIKAKIGSVEEIM